MTSTLEPIKSKEDILDHGPKTDQELRTIRMMGLVFHRVWLSQPCRQNRNHAVFVSKDMNGRYRLTLVRRLPPVRIIRELVTRGRQRGSSGSRPPDDPWRSRCFLRDDLDGRPHDQCVRGRR